jgi:cathepsin L
MFALIGLVSCLPTLQREEKMFVSWMRAHNQVFTGDEYHLRLGIFLTNERFVKEHNSVSTFQVELNHLAVLTPAEYKGMLGYRPSATIEGEVMVSNVEAPDSWDWRERKVVNAIKDQGQCGSCWAFAVVQGHESQWALKKGQLISLSEQNIVDCVGTCGGCNGGNNPSAYDWVIKHQKGLWEKETDYPYHHVTQKCQWDEKKGICPIKSWYRPTTTKDEKELDNGLYEGGVCAIGIDAGHTSFQLYKGGVYDEPKCSSTGLDHAVGLIGYGHEKDVPYWIVRNSWGSVWGEAGYIRMSRNKGNQCGVATDTIITRAG